MLQNLDRAPLQEPKSYFIILNFEHKSRNLQQNLKEINKIDRPIPRKPHFIGKHISNKVICLIVFAAKY